MPKFYGYNYPYFYPYYRNYKKQNVNPNFSTIPKDYVDKKSSTNCTTENKVEKQSENRSFLFPFSTEKPVFEVLGFKIFMDDILILCILFFLYEENVKDEVLYIILLLLLIS